MGKNNPKQLIVEGNEDLFSIACLMKAHIDWPDQPNAPVNIQVKGSVSEILKREYLTTQLKAPNLETLGIVIDADTSPIGHFQSIVTSLSEMVGEFPDRLPTSGLIVQTQMGKRFGLWIMPDNEQEGAIETFLSLLVPEKASDLWMHAISSSKQALQHGATYIPTHFQKAAMHSFLAWQDPPGQPFGRAITRKVLDQNSPSAQNFVAWFRRLYD